MTDTTSGWNHNIHYHDLILAALPNPCTHTLDVGCGTGLLTRKLAPHCTHVLGIDRDPHVLARAPASPQPNITCLEADAMTHPFPPGTFTCITAVAVLHHLPLELALQRFRDLLTPGGVLIVIGLYRPHGPADLLWAVAGRAASWTLRRSRNLTHDDAAISPPQETLARIRTAANRILPGSTLQRRLLFRYSLLWHKPHDPATSPSASLLQSTPLAGVP